MLSVRRQVLLTFGLSILSFFFLSSPYPQYGDSGLMLIQARQLARAGFATFSFDYRGESLDPDRNFLPFHKPFLGIVEREPYIDFPPYFPTIVAPFTLLPWSKSIFLPATIALACTFFLWLRLGDLLEIKPAWLPLLLYGSGSGILIYNHVLHETPLALLLLTISLYYLIKLFSTDTFVSALGFGFAAGLALFFRLEAGLFALAGGLALLALRPRLALRRGPVAALFFSVPVLILLYLNQEIHGHPLGLRYLLTTYVADRWQIIHGLLFSDTRGLYYQAPLFLLCWLGPIFLKDPVSRLLWLFHTILLLLTIALMPNHGDHIAPRYLYPPLLPAILLLCRLAGVFLERVRDRSLPGKFFLGLWVLLAFFSFMGFVGNLRWLFAAGEQVASLCRAVKEAPDKILIFDDYGWALNLQCRYEDKIQFVLLPEGAADQQNAFLQNLKNRQFQSVGFLGKAAPTWALEKQERFSVPGGMYYTIALATGGQ